MRDTIGRIKSIDEEIKLKKQEMEELERDESQLRQKQRNLYIKRNRELVYEFFALLKDLASSLPFETYGRIQAVLAEMSKNDPEVYKKLARDEYGLQYADTSERDFVLGLFNRWNFRGDMDFRSFLHIVLNDRHGEGNFFVGGR